MILEKYSEFLVEKAIMSLNESIVQYSDKFKQMLREIDSPISVKLLDAYGEDFDVKSNWFDLGKDADHITFIVDAKAQKMKADKVSVVDAAPILNFSYFKQLIDKIGFNKENAYIPMDEEVGEIKAEARDRYGNLHYLLYFDPEGKKQCVIRKDYTRPDTTEFFSNNRQEIRVGRGVRALLKSIGVDFPDKEIEEFVNKWKSTFEIAQNAFSLFEEVSGDQIATYYHYTKYLNYDAGDLGNSCMKEKKPDFFQIYTRNPTVVRLLILRSPKNKEKIVGRALVWNLTNPQITYMDRIYTEKQSQNELFRSYARKQGWHYKPANNNQTTPRCVNPNGKVVAFTALEVHIRPLCYTKYPYVDTLKHLIEKSRYHLLTTEEMDGCKTLESTDGTWYQEGECEDCGGSGRVGCDDCEANGIISCGECQNTGMAQCEDCDGDGSYDCDDCRGKGIVNGETCENCEGQKKVTCTECEGEKTVVCRNCDGEGGKECKRCDGTAQVPCRAC